MMPRTARDVGYFKCGRIQPCANWPPRSIGALNHIAAVIDLYTAKRPSIACRHICHCGTWLPIGHRHKAVVVSQGGTCGKR